MIIKIVICSISLSERAHHATETARPVRRSNHYGGKGEGLHPESPSPLAAHRVEHAAVSRSATGGVVLGKAGWSRLLPTRLVSVQLCRKEAVLSSQIEGTQSSLSDLLAFENGQAPGVPLDDVAEVSSYVAALDHGLKRLRGGFPLSLRLIREIHAVLLSKGRGSGKQPGEFRTSQNWIGGSRPGNAAFVPPPWEELPECLGAWECFLHGEPIALDPLTRAAMAHVQFETLHPFLDGNGRVGRLVIVLLLLAEGILAEPMLYLSLYLKQHRAAYYELLQRVRMEGDWEVAELLRRRGGDFRERRSNSPTPAETLREGSAKNSKRGPRGRFYPTGSSPPSEPPCSHIFSDL